METPFRRTPRLSAGTLCVVLCAGLVASVCSPGLAEIVYTPMTGYTHGVGIYNPGDPTQLFSVYVTSSSGPMQSDTFTFTFAMHHTNIYYNTAWLHFFFAYDNDGLEVLSAQPMGVSIGGNTWSTYYPTTWPNPSSGWTAVSLSQWFNHSEYQPQPPSAAVPFFQVQLHVKSASYSQVNSFRITSMVLLSHFATTFNLYEDDFQYGYGAIHLVPEPASMSLLFGGLAGIAGGVVRRRRRAA